MAIYQEMMEDHCSCCARPAVFVRVVRAISPLLYNAAGSWFPSTSHRAWLSGASVIVPWECLECGCRLSDQSAIDRRIALPMDSASAPGPQSALLAERPGAR